jgi:hypothetical protein
MRHLILIPLIAVACTKPGPAATTTTPVSNTDTDDPGARIASSGSTVTVTCEFADGWAAVVPREQFREGDPYFMQALIGISEDPSFWVNDTDYGALAPYAAHRCDGEGASFEVGGGDNVLVIGKANTFDGNEYGINGAIRTDGVVGGASFRFGDADLDLSWSCISCPRLYVWDGTGWKLLGEVLVNVIATEATQRRQFGKVHVENGQIRLRLAEEEFETSHVDALLLEIDGIVYAPAASGLDAVDGVRLDMHQGDAVELVYEVALPDGDRDAVVAATGYYVPLDGIR